MVKPLGYIYPFKKENGHKPEALICTNSDKVAELSVLVEALPEMHFHVAAVQTAFLHNHLILAFTETLHNANYVAAEHVYAKENVDWMIGCLKSVIADENKLKEHLKAQHNAAMAETMGIYLQM